MNEADEKSCVDQVLKAVEDFNRKQAEYEHKQIIKLCEENDPEDIECDNKMLKKVEIYLPPKVDREYYNIFVLAGEEFDRPYIKIPRDRALNQCMTQETIDKFAPMTEENRDQIKTMPSLFMAENNQYGKADESQNVIYGFVSDIKVCDNYVKVYYCGYKLDVPQWRLNELLEELQLVGNDKFNELNRTHWSIKRCDLIQELLEGGVQIPVFTIGDLH